MAQPLVAPLPLRATDGPYIDSPDADTDFYVLYDPHAALDGDLGSTEELRSASNNRLFVSDPSPDYEPHRC